MKLIIDIPENLYKATVNGLDANEIWDLRLSVKNGIPLDKIRAEIQENVNYNKKMHYQGIVAGLLLTLDIIDKYRNEVSK